jgi:hypothetical protein
MDALERRVKIQKHLIQQVKLEIDEEKRKQSILQGGKLASGPAGQRNRGDKEIDVGSSIRSSHQRSMGQKKTSRSSRAEEETRKRSG